MSFKANGKHYYIDVDAFPKDGREAVALLAALTPPTGDGGGD